MFNSLFSAIASSGVASSFAQVLSYIWAWEP